MSIEIMQLDTNTGVIELTGDIVLKPNLSRQEFERYSLPKDASAIIRTLIHSSYSIPHILDQDSQSISAIIDFRMDILHKVTFTVKVDTLASEYQDKRYAWGYLKTESPRNGAGLNVVLTFFAGEDAVEPIANMELSQLLYRLTSRKSKSRFNLFANLGRKRCVKSEQLFVLASRVLRKDANILKSDLKILINQYKKSVAENPNDLIARFALAQLLFTKGAINESIFEFAKILNHNPNHLPSLKALGCILFEQEDYLGSIIIFSYLVYLSPYDPEARHDLGQSYIAEGHKEQGIVELREALVIRPGTRLFTESLDHAMTVAS